MQRSLKSSNERQYARADAIAQLVHVRNDLQESLKKFDGAKEVRRAIQRARAAEENYHGIQNQNVMNEFGLAGRIAIGIFSGGTSEAAAAIAKNGAVNQACQQLDDRKNELRVVREKYDIWDDVSQPSAEEKDIESKISQVNAKIQELERVRTEYVNIDIGHFQGQFNYDVGNVNNGAMNFKS
jgi:hypothetical protein